MKNKNTILAGLLVGGGLLALYLYKRSQVVDDTDYSTGGEGLFGNLTGEEEEVYNFITDNYPQTLENESDLRSFEIATATITYMSPYYYYQNDCTLNGNCPGGLTGTDLGLVPVNEWSENMCVNPDNCVLNDYVDWVNQYYEQ